MPPPLSLISCVTSDNSKGKGEGETKQFNFGCFPVFCHKLIVDAVDLNQDGNEAEHGWVVAARPFKVPGAVAVVTTHE